MEGQDVRPRQLGWDVTDSSAEKGPGAGRPAQPLPGSASRQRADAPVTVRHPARKRHVYTPDRAVFRTAGGRSLALSEVTRRKRGPRSPFSEGGRGGHGRRPDVGVSPRAHRSIGPQEQGVRQDHPSGWTPSRNGSRFPSGNAGERRIGTRWSARGHHACPGARQLRRKKDRGESDPARGERSAGSDSFGSWSATQARECEKSQSESPQGWTGRLDPHATAASAVGGTSLVLRQEGRFAVPRAAPWSWSLGIARSGKRPVIPVTGTRGRVGGAGRSG